MLQISFLVGKPDNINGIIHKRKVLPLNETGNNCINNRFIWRAYLKCCLLNKTNLTTINNCSTIQTSKREEFKWRRRIIIATMVPLVVVNLIAQYRIADLDQAVDETH